jgi:hypothetical protein
MAGRADCNSDLDQGTQGDGCEASLADDPANCGSCGTRCSAEPASVASCSAAQCATYTATTETAFAGDTLHGGMGGGPYMRQCERGEVVVGLDVVSDADTAWAFAVLCGRLALTNQAGKTKLPEGLSLSSLDPHVLPLVGCDGPNSPGAIPPACLRPEGAAPPTTRMQCPAGAIVTGVGGATTTYSNASIGLKQVVLTCSAAAIGPQRELSFAEESKLSAGTDTSATEIFQTGCPKGAAVVGFSGNSGAYIDSIRHSCSPVTISLGAGM